MCELSRSLLYVEQRSSQVRGVHVAPFVAVYMAEITLYERDQLAGGKCLIYIHNIKTVVVRRPVNFLESCSS